MLGSHDTPQKENVLNKYKKITTINIKLNLYCVCVWSELFLYIVLNHSAQPLRKSRIRPIKHRINNSTGGMKQSVITGMSNDENNSVRFLQCSQKKQAKLVYELNRLLMISVFISSQRVDSSFKKRLPRLLLFRSSSFFATKHFFVTLQYAICQKPYRKCEKIMDNNFQCRECDIHQLKIAEKENSCNFRKFVLLKNNGTFQLRKGVIQFMLSLLSCRMSVLSFIYAL